MRRLNPSGSTLLLIFVFACGGTAEQEQSAPRATPLVEAVAARFGALPMEQTTPGAVRARNQVAIRPEIAGRAVAVLARGGETVERGQPLVRLDDSETRERLRQAEADVRLEEAAAVAARARADELETRVARTRTLAEQELVSEQELDTLAAQLDALRATADEAAARVEQARAAVDERRSALDKTVVRAPVSGSLGERRVEMGMRVDPSSVLFEIGDLDELIVEVNLTETMLAEARVDLPVVIESRGGDEPVRATLSRISPFLAEESFTALGEIDVDNRQAGLRPGMFVSVRILVGQSRQATLVPVSAVWEDPATGQRGVFVVEEAAGLELPAATGAGSDTPRAVSFRQVEPIAVGGGAAGVEGIEEGAWVVTVGQHLLAEEIRAAAEQPAAETDRADTVRAATARVRPVAWERVLELQDLQNEDLLEGFLDKQRRISAALGAEIPPSEDVVNRVLERSSTPAAAPNGP